jgi:hypothetical protein
MIRKGIPQSVAMQISGHRTISIFKRYDIVDEGDLRLAALKTSRDFAAVPNSSHDSVTMPTCGKSRSDQLI